MINLIFNSLALIRRVHSTHAHCKRSSNHTRLTHTTPLRRWRIQLNTGLDWLNDAQLMAERRHTFAIFAPFPSLNDHQHTTPHVDTSHALYTTPRCWLAEKNDDDDDDVDDLSARPLIVMCGDRTNKRWRWPRKQIERIECLSLSLPTMMMMLMSVCAEEHRKKKRVIIIHPLLSHGRARTLVTHLHCRALSLSLTHSLSRARGSTHYLVSFVSLAHTLATSPPTIPSIKSSVKQKKLARSNYKPNCCFCSPRFWR